MLKTYLCIVYLLSINHLYSQVESINISPAKVFPKMPVDFILEGYDISRTKPFPVMVLVSRIADEDISPAKPFPKRTAKVKIEGYDISPIKPLRKVSWSFKTIKQKFKYIA